MVHLLAAGPVCRDINIFNSLIMLEYFSLDQTSPNINRAVLEVRLKTYQYCLCTDQPQHEAQELLSLTPSVNLMAMLSSHVIIQICQI